ncbi:MAG: hypothetical protein RLZZ288_1212 [Planctomycetota bacterium]
MQFQMKIIAALAFLLGSLCMSPLAVAQDAAPAESKSTDAPLQAIFMEVQGKVRWRAGEQSPWKEAAVNDLVDAGAEIRTGLKSRATLRVGKNATVLVDAGTSFQLPQIVQDGETLRTLATVKTGRVDFKVDKVGFSNDFKVITPQTTLSVRGTGFGVNSGPLNGVEVTGARTNTINAIEIRYVASNLAYFMSGESKTSSGQKDPVQNAWISTVGPPPVVGTLVGNDQLEQAASQGQSGNSPTNPQAVQQQAAAETNAESLIESPIPPLLTSQDAAAEAVRVAATALQGDGDALVSAASGVLAAANERNTRIGDVTGNRDALVSAWSGGQSYGSSQLQSAASQLQAFAKGADSDVRQMQSLRSDLGVALGSERDTHADVNALLDQMGALDDRWNDGATGLSRQAESVVSAIKSLHDAVQDAYGQAVPADSAYGTVRVAANLAESRSDAASAALAALRGEVRDFKAEVERLAATGKFGNLAVDQLRQSVATLERAESRVQDALTAVASGKRSLADARAVGDRSSMATAVSARDQSVAISDAAAALRRAVADNAREIERVRFDGYFATASSAVTTFQDVGDAAVAASERATMLSNDIRDRSDTGASNGRLNQVRNLTTSLERYWESGNGPSPRDQMEGWLGESDADRAAIEDSLALLTQTIAGGATSDAGRFILDSDMLPLGAKWAENGEPLADVKGIDESVQRRNTLVQAAADDATGAYREAVQAATTASNEAGSASARLQQLKTDVKRYHDEHTRLVQAGRGGEGAAARLLQLAADLEAKGDIVTRGIRAGDEAAAAVRNATTAGEAQFFAAVQQAANRSATIALDSANKRLGIEANAAVIRETAAEGQSRYVAAYGGSGK